MNSNNINWEELAKQLLWRCYVSEGWKSYSGYSELDNGELALGAEVSSNRISYNRLTWQQLLLKLGVHTDMITPDGHDCSICPENKGKVCNGFKNGVAHGPRCSWWVEHINKG